MYVRLFLEHRTYPAFENYQPETPYTSWTERESEILGFLMDENFFFLTSASMGPDSLLTFDLS